MAAENGIEGDDPDDTSIAIEDDDIDIVLEASKTSKFPRCIFKIPKLLRRHNVRAYKPDIVTIGPYHPRGGKRFRAMEDLKTGYLRDLLLHMDSSHTLDMSLEEMLEKTINFFSNHNTEKGLVEFEKRARDFYAQPPNLEQKDFLHMMILDGCFLVQLFRKRMIIDQRDPNDPIFNMDCMFQYICHDLLLLENQIPWFVLQLVYDLTTQYFQSLDFSLPKLILTVLSSQRQLAHNCKSYLRHLNHNEDDKSILHILDLIRTSIVFSFKPQPFDEPSFNSNIQFIPSATALSEAGIKFKMSSHTCESILNIEFERGVISIPHLVIGELTESLFRNLIAFEQCCHGRSHKITSYAVLMDNLIGCRQDMKFLCDQKIIGNWLSADNGSKFFKKLHNDTLLIGFYYGGLCDEVRKQQTRLKRYRETFNRNYCSDP